jgi:hypothetical protein
MPLGDDTTIKAVKDQAKEAAAKLVRVGIFHANQENKNFNDPKLLHDGRDVKTYPMSVGPVIIE